MTRVIGLISGTSMDGIDAALVELSGTTADLQVDLLAGATYPYPATLKRQIVAIAGGAPLSMADLAKLDDSIAQQFAQAALVVQTKHPAADLIGSHGQTVYHRSSRHALGYSVQLGRGAAIAQITGIPTVSNFRAADIAAGGEGAPLVPPVDACLLSHSVENRCVQNLGGIGNVTYLPASDRVDRKIIGWDTGPANSLLDLAVQHFSQGAQFYDANGAWAASGTPCLALVERWMGQDYFQQCLRDAEASDLTAADLLATLTELTVASIAHSYRNFLPQLPDRILLCGGGSRNLYLKQRLQAQFSAVAVSTTDEVGLNADLKEAIAFAVLGFWHTQGIPSNLPDVTGAHRAVILGETHLPIGS